MKKNIAVFMLFSSSLILYARNDIKSDSVRIRSNWAVSVSYSPYFALFSNSAEPLKTDYKIYPTGISLSLELKKANERSGLSSGVTYRTKNINHSNSSETITFWEVPIQVKHYFKRAESKFYPYVAATIKICRFKSIYDPHIPLSEPFLDYLPIIDLGFGSNIYLQKNIDGMFETNFGYSLSDILPNRSYIDFKVGLRFKFF